MHRDRKNLVYSHWSRHRYRHQSAVSNIAQLTLRHCQYRGAFIALLPTENNNVLDLKCSLHHCKQITNLFVRYCQQLYVVNKRPLTELCAPCQFVSK
jgi:hypothetical protein